MTSPVPILYSYRRCPYAMRARMALRYSQIVVEIREITLKDKPASMLQRSPKGTVPVLVLATGEVIDESLNIMRWALAQHDPDNWRMTDNSDAISEMERLLIYNDQHFKLALDRYKYAIRFPQHPPEFYRGEGELFLCELEACLEKHVYLCGETCTLGDMAIFPFIRQFVAVDQVWFAQAAFPRLRHWLEGLLQSQIFMDIMEKREIWVAS